MLDKSTASMPMYLIHTRASSLPNEKLTGSGGSYVDHLKAYGDVQDLNRRGMVTRLAPAAKSGSDKNNENRNVKDEDDRGGVNITRHGMFCRISLKCGGVESILAATDEVCV